METKQAFRNMDRRGAEGSHAGKGEPPAGDDSDDEPPGDLNSIREKIFLFAIIILS